MLTSISSPQTSDDDPSLSADRELLVFNSEREGGSGEEDIWLSQRDAGGAWMPPRPVVELNSEQRETGIALSSDGLTIWWSSDRSGGAGGLDVYSAHRDRRDAEFSAIERVAELSSPGDDLISRVDGGLNVALLARRDDEDDDYDLFIARRAQADAPWQEPSPLAELNTAQAETDAFLLPDERSIVFTREHDLMLARRDSVQRGFGQAEPLSELNSADDDRDAWVTPAFDYIVFASDRGGSYALYEASR
jgi:Tol biopolymer transport system component